MMNIRITELIEAKEDLLKEIEYISNVCLELKSKYKQSAHSPDVAKRYGYYISKIVVCNRRVEELMIQVAVLEDLISLFNHQ